MTGERTELDPVEVGYGGTYRLLTSAVVPRPIAWVSSRSAAGVDNLAPHSFFTVSCVEPPMLQFTSIGVKDTLRNIRATGEFVVCLGTEPMFTHINATATDFPPDVSEFTAVGLTREPSRRVAPSRVAESPIAFECRLEHELELGDSTVVIGRVLHIAIDTEIMTDDGRGRLLPAAEKLRPLARLGRTEWSTLGEIRTIRRIAHADWPGHFTAGG